MVIEFTTIVNMQMKLVETFDNNNIHCMKCESVGSGNGVKVNWDCIGCGTNTDNNIISTCMDCKKGNSMIRDSHCECKRSRGTLG